MSACAEPPFLFGNRFEQRRRRSNHCSSFRAGFGGLLSFANPATNLGRANSGRSQCRDRTAGLDPYHTFTIAGHGDSLLR